MAFVICQVYQTLMSNKYETFRDTIKLAIVETVVKESDDKSRVSYTWSMDSVFTACGEKCQIADTKNLPEELKHIIRFEFNKLKESITNGDGWTFKRSTVTPVLTIDNVEYRRTDTFTNSAVSLEMQLQGAVALLNRAGVSLSKAKTAESAEKLNRRIKRLHKEIAGLRDEMDKQKLLVIEVNKTVKAETDRAKTETVSK